MHKYKVVRDGAGWGVIDEEKVFINDAPLSKAEAQELFASMREPKTAHFADENPLWEQD